MVNKTQMRPSFLLPPLFDLVFVFSFWRQWRKRLRPRNTALWGHGRVSQSCYVKPLSLIVHIANISAGVNKLHISTNTQFSIRFVMNISPLPSLPFFFHSHLQHFSFLPIFLPCLLSFLVPFLVSFLFPSLFISFHLSSIPSSHFSFLVSYFLRSRSP